MTNEQTAVMLDGYENLLRNAIEDAKKQIKPTICDNIIMGKLEEWPELFELEHMLEKLQNDINIMIARS